jgi:hypothetical protein
MRMQATEACAVTPDPTSTQDLGECPVSSAPGLRLQAQSPGANPIDVLPPSERRPRPGICRSGRPAAAGQPATRLPNLASFGEPYYLELKELFFARTASIGYVARVLAGIQT